MIFRIGIENHHTHPQITRVRYCLVGEIPYAKFNIISCKIERAKWLPWHRPPGQVCPLCSAHPYPFPSHISKPQWPLWPYLL